MVKKFIGFHGTSKHRAKKICVSETFESSVDTDDRPQWLGDGIYFFEDHIKWAIKYATDVKKFSTDYAVIRSEIHSEHLFDLHDPDEFDLFEYFRLRIKKIYEDNGRRFKCLNGVVINYIYNEKIREFDVVRHSFSFPKTEFGDVWMINLSHIQLCVRNPACIRSILEEVV